jgi:hypothetical protein
LLVVVVVEGLHLLVMELVVAVLAVTELLPVHLVAAHLPKQN